MRVKLELHIWTRSASSMSRRQRRQSVTIRGEGQCSPYKLMAISLLIFLAPNSESLLDLDHCLTHEGRSSVRGFTCGILHSLWTTFLTLLNPITMMFFFSGFLFHQNLSRVLQDYHHYVSPHVLTAEVKHLHRGVRKINYQNPLKSTVLMRVPHEQKPYDPRVNLIIFLSPSLVPPSMDMSQ